MVDFIVIDLTSDLTSQRFLADRFSNDNVRAGAKKELEKKRRNQRKRKMSIFEKEEKYRARVLLRRIMGKKKKKTGVFPRAISTKEGVGTIPGPSSARRFDISLT